MLSGDQFTVRTGPYTPFFLLICPDSTTVLGISVTVEDSRVMSCPLQPQEERGLWHIVPVSYISEGMQNYSSTFLMLIALLEELELFKVFQAFKTSTILQLSLITFLTLLLFQLQARDYKYLNFRVSNNFLYKLGAVLDSTHLDQKTGFPSSAH